MTGTVRVELTDAEWMSLLDGEREGLARCCANLSALRDVLFQVVREGCEVSSWNRLQLERTFAWFLEGHDLPPGGALAKLAEQLGLSTEPPEEHPKQEVE